jgi:predicted ATP-dependent endonuclease of OLD family
MFYISSVEIHGFWGQYKVATDLYRDVSVFIGKNGTGKTTFINILQSVLQLNLGVLSNIDFSKILIHLTEGNKRRTITVSRQEDDNLPFQVFRFTVGRKAYLLPYIPIENESTDNIYRNRLGYDEYTNLRKEMNEIINISVLSVHRNTYDRSFDERPLRKLRTFQSPIDQRLELLIQQLTRYQLSLAQESNTISLDFQKEVLKSVLYNPAFDKFTAIDFSSAELVSQEGDLSRAYKELGVLDKDLKNKIKNHINALSESINEVQIFNDRKGSLSIDNVIPLSLLNRTRHIINLSLFAQQRKQEVLKPITVFVKTVRDFIEDKYFDISDTGEITIRKGSSVISISDLSSGEKQLLILLIETLLQKGEPFVFIADEPEISLHIEWQAKIISSIKSMNNSAQIIVATHSPEIAGGWKKNIIDMEDIISG